MGRSYVEGEVTLPMTFTQDLESKRPETGVCQHGSDWPGIFIRGDNAHSFQHPLAVALQHVPDEHWTERCLLQSLLELLKSCEVKPLAELAEALDPEKPKEG